MGTTRFAIKYDSPRLATALGIGPGSSGVDVGPDEVRVRMGPAGWAFKLDIPRGSIRSAERVAAGAAGTFGVHGLGGRWLVNGYADGLVELTFQPPGHTDRVLGTLFRRVRINSLTLSLVDPGGFIAAQGVDNKDW